MSLIKWEPFGDMDRFWEELRFPTFNLSKMDESLAVDIYEKDDKVFAEMNIPGIDPNDVNIEVEDSYLRVSGSKKEEKEEKKKNYYSREIRRGSFERTVHLPCPVQRNKVNAEYENGVLKVSMPKATEIKSNKIKIQIKDKKKK